MRRAFLSLACCFAMAVTACSSSSSTPNIDANAALTSLSTGDQGRLCDWEAQQYGGYGKAISCGGGLVPAQRGPTDQASCVGGLPPPSASAFCNATVGQFEACVQWKKQNGCGTADPPLDCLALRNPNCSPPDAGGD
jgi:hypothetical protein